MSRVLTLQNRQRTRTINLRFLRRIANTLLFKLEPVKEFDLGVCLVARAQIIRLNETVLHHRGSTDVITFNHGRLLETGRLNGEIVICIDEAVSQARRFGTPWQSELVRYLIHGLLHLCGYDDRFLASRRRMRREEDRLLKIVTAQFPLSKLSGKTRLPL